MKLASLDARNSTADATATARLEVAVRSILGAPARAERALQYGPTDGLPELRAVLADTPIVQRVAVRRLDRSTTAVDSRWGELPVPALEPSLRICARRFVG